MTDTTEATDAPRSSRPPPRPRRLRWLVELGLVALVYFAITGWRERHLLTAHATAAPAFSLMDLDGHRVRLADLRGKSVMVEFWATWCGVCREEFGAMNAVQRSLSPDQRFYAIVADADDPARIRRFVAEHHIEYPVLLGTDAVLRAYRVSVFPTTYFIGPDGKVAGHTTGMSTRWGLETRLGCAKR